jgi:hypothetical protein
MNEIELTQERVSFESDRYHVCSIRRRREGALGVACPFDISLLTDGASRIDYQLRITEIPRVHGLSRAAQSDEGDCFS